MKNYFNKGFTLAEVLITLAIIGVVAAMTVPTLMTSTRGKEFEVGAQKALSTIANAMQMRYAMDGVTLADYRPPSGSHTDNRRILYYLTTVSNNPRPGEKPALQIVQKTDNFTKTSYKLPDGMFMISPVWGPSDNYIYYLAFDVNGERGPTRIGTQVYYNGGASATYGTFAQPYINFPLKNKSGSTVAQITETTTSPTNNNNPDIVVFAIDPDTGTVKPAGQRTRNILATGNAMISQ